jgi:cobalt/nickel transport system permease protein
VHIPDGFVSPPIAVAGAAVAVAGLGVCVRRAGRDATERQLPLAGAVLFTAEYALGGAAGVPLRTVAVSTIGVYALVAVCEGLVTALVVRGLLAVRADLVQVAHE